MPKNTQKYQVVVECGEECKPEKMRINNDNYSKVCRLHMYLNICKLVNGRIDSLFIQNTTVHVSIYNIYKLTC